MVEGAQPQLPLILPLLQAMESLPELQAAMVDYFLANAAQAGEGLEVLPGVVPLLTYLRERGDVAVCLVTGIKIRDITPLVEYLQSTGRIIVHPNPHAKSSSANNPYSVSLLE